MMTMKPSAVITKHIQARLVEINCDLDYLDRISEYGDHDNPSGLTAQQHEDYEMLISMKSGILNELVRRGVDTPV